jgi:hypothetical protein
MNLEIHDSDKELPAFGVGSGEIGTICEVSPDCLVWGYDGDTRSPLILRLVRWFDSVQWEYDDGDALFSTKGTWWCYVPEITFERTP